MSEEKTVMATDELLKRIEEMQARIVELSKPEAKATEKKESEKKFRMQGVYAG